MEESSPSMNKYNLLANGFGQIQPEEADAKVSNNNMDSSEEPPCSKPYGQVLHDASAGIRIKKARVSSVSLQDEMEVPSPSPMNLLPPEMLEKILGYVGLNNGSRDLRSCRLVCTTWNQISLQLLPPCTLTLSIDELQAQIASEDCKETDPDKLLHKYIRQNTDKNKDNRVQNPPPVFNINLTYKGNCFMLDVQLIFKTILEHQESHMLYPIVSIHLEEAGDCFINEPTLLIQMIANSGPMLKSLKLLDSGLNDFPLLTTTKENSLIQVLNTIHASSIALQEVELSIYDERSLTSLTRLQFNALKSLHIYQSSNATLRREFGSLSDFLALNCPQLTKFEVTVYEFGLHYGNYQFNNYESALGLAGSRSKLTHLGFYYVEADPCLHICPQLSHKGRFCTHLAYLSYSFEALQTLSTDLATFMALTIKLTPEIAARYEDYIVFPSVSTLIVQIKEPAPLTFNNTQDEIDFKVGVHDLVRRWMPNLTKLILDVNSTITWSGSPPENDNRIFLDTMIGTFLDLDGIKGVELVNYVAQDLLVEIAGKAGSSFTELRQNLEHLRLRRSFPGSGPVEDEHEDPEIFLSRICTIFPNLRLIQIDYEVLKGAAADGGTLDFEQLLDKMHLIKTKFPNVQFELF